ncbi:MAG: hypothetical protein OXU23_17545 [Candidatus Poribacteria bacterium]|nr:hypothetical protein [Candidatus Poribacteria bacterium]
MVLRQRIKAITEYWRKWKFGFGFYGGPILVIVYGVIARDKFTSFDKSLELLSIYTAVAALLITLLILVIDSIIFIIMLLSDWYANKIEKEKQERKRMNEHVVKEVARQRILMNLREAEQRGLSLEEIIKELELPKRITLLDFQTLEPFDLVINNQDGEKFDLKGIIWITVTLRENNTYSLSAITQSEDITGLPDLTNNVILISEDEYERINDICEKL